jgi:hypothetical protein
MVAEYGLDARLAKTRSLKQPYGSSIRNPYEGVDRLDIGDSKEFLDRKRQYFSPIAFSTKGCTQID